MATNAARMAAEGATIPDAEIWGEDVAPDELLDPETVVLEEGGILGETKAPSKTKRIAQKVGKAELRKVMQAQLDKLPITPNKVSKLSRRVLRDLCVRLGFCDNGGLLLLYVGGT